MKDNEENTTYLCSKCRKDFEVTMPKGHRFKPSVVKKLRCFDCAWGGKKGLARHTAAGKRFGKAFGKEVAKRISCSPGPGSFSVQLTASKVTRKKNVNWFEVGTFEGVPVRLIVVVKETK